MPIVNESSLDIIGYRAISLPNETSYKTVFAHGFPRKVDVYGESYDLYYRDNEDRAGDMWPGSAQCCTTKLNVAALFPNDVAIPDTYVFLVYVENGFDTYTQQQMDAWGVLEKEDYAIFEVEEIRREVTWPLYAEEFATLAIPAEHVIGCVKCERTWETTDWKDGGAYRLDGALHWNEKKLNVPISQFRVNKACNKFKGLVERHNRGKLPKTTA